MATMVELVGLAAASLLVFSGCLKLRNSGSLALSLLSLGFSDFHVSSMIKVIPIVEIFVGITSLGSLLLNINLPWLPFFTYAILAMFYLIFTISIVMLRANSYDGDCGCFGDWIKMSASIIHILFNLAITYMLIHGCIIAWRAK